MILRLVDQQKKADRTRPGFAGDQWQQLERLAAAVGMPQWPVDVVLISDDVMADLNRRYRQLSSVTDVLSFSYLLASGAGSGDLKRGEGWAAQDLWRDEVPAGADSGDAVGELVLAPDFVAARCAEEGWPLAAETPWLVVHGCLHLVGWDHEDAADRQAMMAAEMKILAGEGLSHPLRQRS